MGFLRVLSLFLIVYIYTWLVTMKKKYNQSVSKYHSVKCISAEMS